MPCARWELPPISRWTGWRPENQRKLAIISLMAAQIERQNVIISCYKRYTYRHLLMLVIGTVPTFTLDPTKPQGIGVQLPPNINQLLHKSEI